jgi:hypothetical protein
MADMGFTPNLIASGDIRPFRFVVISGAFQGAQSAVATDIPVGVTDGSVYQYDQTLHANSGKMITLQPSNTVQIEVGTGGVSAGDYLMSDATAGVANTGRAVTLATANNYATYIALEAGSAGEIIRAFRTGTKKF